ALDLLGRKVVADGGQSLALFANEIRSFCETRPPLREPLLHALAQLESVSQWVREQATGDANAVGAASVEYLHLFGDVAYAYMWSRMAATARERREQEPAFYEAKLATATFYVERLLPRVLSLQASIRAGSAPLYQLPAELF